jgi:glycosyltransferase involved in cell wall biosynthesis
VGGAGIPQNLKRSPHRVLAVPSFLIAFGRALSEFLKDHPADVLITHWLIPTGLVTLGLNRHRPPKVIHLAHSSDVHLLARLPGGRQLTRALSRRGQVVATSNYQRSLLHPALLDGPPPVIPVGIDAPHPCGAKTDSQTGAKKLLIMSRLVPGKGLDAALDLLKWLPGFSLAIAGEGPERARLEIRAQRESLPVEFVGPVSGGAKASFLSSGRFFVFLPAQKDADEFQDNLPVSLMEGMAAGRVVVATPVGAIDELIQDGQSGLLTHGDLESVAKQIEAVDDGQAQNLGQNAAAVVANRHWPQVLKDLAGLLHP